jgi:hypothetical protein
VNNRQSLDLTEEARGLNLMRRAAKGEVPKRLYRDIDVREFGGLEDKCSGIRPQKSQGEIDLSRPSMGGRVSQNHPSRRFGHRDS